MMSIDELETLAAASRLGRRFGKTTAICEAAKMIRATVICANRAQADMISREYVVPTTTLGREIRGTRGPYLADHFAVEHAAEAGAQDLRRLLNFRNEFVTQLREVQRVAKAMQRNERPVDPHWLEERLEGLIQLGESI